MRLNFNEKRIELITTDADIRSLTHPYQVLRCKIIISFYSFCVHPRAHSDHFAQHWSQQFSGEIINTGNECVYPSSGETFGMAFVQFLRRPFTTYLCETVWLPEESELNWWRYCIPSTHIVWICVRHSSRYIVSCLQTERRCHQYVTYGDGMMVSSSMQSQSESRKQLDRERNNMHETRVHAKPTYIHTHTRARGVHIHPRAQFPHFDCPYSPRPIECNSETNTHTHSSLKGIHVTRSATKCSTNFPLCVRWTMHRMTIDLMGMQGAAIVQTTTTREREWEKKYEKKNARK